MTIRFEYDGLPIIKTTSGELKGYKYDGIYTYKGIPYAHAKRWQMAELSSWDGVFDATNYGRVAPLMMQDNPKGEMKCPHMYWPQDEDCLSLNIWTKDVNKKKPVMVWIHGGGYFAGSSIEQLAYDGVNIAKEDCVCVSLNHRLNILGFLDLEPFGEKYKNSANAGLDDIVKALTWIHNNIEAFGGDPDNVTLFGQSGGGMKISLLMQIPAAEGLFHKAIMMSGIGGNFMPPCPRENGDGTLIVTKMLEKLGLSVNDIDKLETMPYQQVFMAYGQAMPEVVKMGGYVGNNPRIDDYCLGEGNMSEFTNQSKNTPVIIGSVFGEFGGFMPLPFAKHEVSDEVVKHALEERFKENTDELISLFKEAYPNNAIADLLVIDTLFRPLNNQFTKDKAALKQAPVYNYLFNVDFPFDGGSAAWHCSDIPYFFGNIEKAPYTNSIPYAEKLQSEMFGAFLAFAKTGDPNHDGMKYWDPSTETQIHTMLFGKDTHQEINHDEKLMAKLKEVLPELTADMLMTMMDDMNIQH